MKKLLIIVFTCWIMCIQCEKKSIEPIQESDEKSIIGKVVDKASGQGLTGSLIKISNDQNAYQTYSGTAGTFAFQNIKSGEYIMTTETIENGKALNDTCGSYSTDLPDWGTIYSSTFTSIVGTVMIEGQTDYSFINVQLLGTNKSAVTTNQGKFRIDFVFPDIYDLYISIDDYQYKNIHIKDITLNKGEVYVVDTVLTYKFKSLILRETTDINIPEPLRVSFAYAEGKYWYGGGEGLYSYDPDLDVETLLLSWHFIGDPKVVYDYSDGIWFTGDQFPTNWLHRKYSLSENKVIDSVETFNTFIGYSLAWDPISTSIIGNRYQEKSIVFYSLLSKQLTNINPTMNYDIKDYEYWYFHDFIVGENNMIYALVKYKPNGTDEELHLCVFDNSENLNTIGIYKFPVFLPYQFSYLSYKEGKIYVIDSDGSIKEVELQ